MKVEFDNNGKFARQLDNNNYENRGEYFEVSVKNTNLVYIVESEHMEWMKKYTWYSGDRKNHPYLLAKENSGIGKRKTLIFHIEIMKHEVDKFKKENKYYIFLLGICNYLLLASSILSIKNFILLIVSSGI